MFSFQHPRHCHHLAPFVIFAGFWQHHRKAFEKYILGGGSSVVQDFWKKMPPQPGMSEKQNWQETCVPLALHGHFWIFGHVQDKHLNTWPQIDRENQSRPQGRSVPGRWLSSSAVLFSFSKMLQQQVQPPKVFLHHLVDQVPCINSSVASHWQGLHKPHEVFTLKAPAQPGGDAWLWGINPHVAEEVVLWSVVEVGLAPGMTMPPQLGETLVIIKDEPLQGHPLISSEQKGFVLKHNSIHSAGEHHKTMHPSHWCIPGSPWPQYGLHSRKKPSDFYCLGCQAMKRIILDHLNSEVAQPAWCVVCFVVGAYVLPHRCNILCNGPWKQFFGHVGQTATNKVAVCAQAFCMHPIRTKKWQPPPWRQLWLE